MTISACPFGVVAAPVERVWELLASPAGYGRFWDLTVTQVDPEGPARAGQRLSGWSRAFGRRWTIEGEIEAADAQRHHIQFRMALPFGVVSVNRLSCEPIDEFRSWLRFG